MNCPELRASIARVGVSNRELAKILGLSEQSFYNKIQGETEFKGSEIKRLATALHLSMEEVNIIFFDQGVNLIHDCTTRNNRSKAAKDSA